MNEARGFLITIEGGEGAGKSTLVSALSERLARAREGGGPGREVVVLREPGGTALGERLRALLLGPSFGGPLIGPRAELFLFAAARAQLLDEVVRPALARSALVLVDRFSDSTVAYQQHGRGLSAQLVRCAVDGAVGPSQEGRPALTLVLDVPPEVGLGRLAGEEPDRIGGEDLEFHRRVREGFLAIAAAEPDRCVLVDGTAAPDAVLDAALLAVAKRLGLAV